jgi:hypothetical protein
MRWIYWMIEFGFIGSTRTSNGIGLPASEKASDNKFNNKVMFVSLKEMDADSTNKRSSTHSKIYPPYQTAQGVNSRL